MKTLVATLALAVLGTGLVAGCQSLDVVGQTATTTFEALLAKEGGQAQPDATGAAWVITAPGGQQFQFSRDFAGSGPDFQVTFDASPFLAAGLDPERLPAERYTFDPATKALALRFDLGNDAFTYAGEATALETFKQIVATHRDAIGYHAELDHYGIALGDGNMFEWAKDLATNDKDIVFVLNPAPFIAAGVDPAKVADWVFGQVLVKDDSGKEVKVDKFLKPYDLP